jgi:archaellum biogenesis ATPase FlaH
VIYGPPATGKTHLAFEVVKYLLSKSLKVSFIATESSTLTFARHVYNDLNIRAVITKEQLLKEVILSTLSNEFIVIDSINWLFRSFNDETAEKELSFISSLLSLMGGFATGQISEIDEESKMSMDTWVLPWVKVVGITKKFKEGLIELKIERPINLVLEYRITRDGVMWI